MRAVVLTLLLITACATASAPLEYPGTLAFLRDGSGFPVDPPHRPGGARAVWQAAGDADSRQFLETNAPRIAADVRRGSADPVLWAMLRHRLRIDGASPPSPRGLMRRREREWERIEQMFAALPPPTSLSEDLFRRNVQRELLNESAFLFNIRPEFSHLPLLGAMPLQDVDAQGRMRRTLNAMDEANIAHLRSMLGDRDWVDDRVDGPGAQDEAWQVVARARAPQAQREMLERMAVVAHTGRVPREFAGEWDRHAVWESRPQRYGTQLQCWCGDYVAAGGVEDPERLDERRAALNLGPWTQDRDEARRRGRCPPNAPIIAQCLSRRPG